MKAVVITEGETVGEGEGLAQCMGLSGGLHSPLEDAWH